MDISCKTLDQNSESLYADTKQHPSTSHNDNMFLGIVISEGK